MSKFHKKRGKKKHEKTSHPKQNITSPQPSHKKRKKKHHKGIGIGKIGKGVVKRVDSVGKFTGGIIKTQSNAISNLTNAISNPIVLIGGLAVVAFVVLNK